MLREQISLKCGKNAEIAIPLKRKNAGCESPKSCPYNDLLFDRKTSSTKMMKCSFKCKFWFPRENIQKETKSAVSE